MKDIYPAEEELLQLGFLSGSYFRINWIVMSMNYRKQLIQRKESREEGLKCKE